MFYKYGCGIVYTQGSCNKILWNDVNAKTRNSEYCHHNCTNLNFSKEFFKDQKIWKICKSTYWSYKSFKNKKT